MAPPTSEPSRWAGTHQPARASCRRRTSHGRIPLRTPNRTPSRIGDGIPPRRIAPTAMTKAIGKPSVLAGTHQPVPAIRRRRTSHCMNPPASPRMITINTRPKDGWMHGKFVNLSIRLSEKLCVHVMGGIELETALPMAAPTANPSMLASTHWSQKPVPIFVRSVFISNHFSFHIALIYTHSIARALFPCHQTDSRSVGTNFPTDRESWGSVYIAGPSQKLNLFRPQPGVAVSNPIGSALPQASTISLLSNMPTSAEPPDRAGRRVRHRSQCA